ncbi:MAG: MFS transporter [Brevibacterium sp.]
MPSWLIALLAAAFVLYTDDYVIAGILPEISSDLQVSEGQAGQLVTVFSLTVAVVAPVAAVALARLPRHRLITGALLVFIAANGLAAVAPSFGVLMAVRVLAAVAAAAATPAIFAFAARQAPAGKAGRYLAVVSFGVTGSIAAGVPIGAWIGGTFDWRATFAVMGLSGVLVVLAILVAVPRGQEHDRTLGLREQLGILLQRPISLCLIANCSLMTGSMMMLTYLAPYLATVSGAEVEERALAFGLAGAAGFIGIWLGGTAADRWGADRALLFGISAIAVAMIVLWLIWFGRPVPLPIVLVATTVWGGMAFWNAPAIQVRLTSFAGPLAGQALGLNTSGTYLGVSCGAAIGGLALAELGVGALPLISAAFACGAVLLLACARHDSMKGNHAP